MNVLLSIKPKWAKLIYEGKKTVEWRKSVPRHLMPEDMVFLYETAPVKKITGYMSVHSFGRFCVEDIMAGEDRYGLSWVESGCVPIEDLLAYEGRSSSLVAWSIGMARRLSRSLDVQEIGLKHPPQSWCYTPYMMEPGLSAPIRAHYELRECDDGFERIFIEEDDYGHTRTTVIGPWNGEGL